MNNKSIKSIAIFLIILFLSACQEEKSKTTLPFFTDTTYTPKWIEKESKEYKSIHRIKGFKFTDHKGKEVTNASFKNKIYIADFFFTSCPSICPKLTANLLKVQESFINDDEIKIISHTVMPWKDSVEVLDEYAVNMGIEYPKWHLVTGDEKVIYSLARSSYFADETFGYTANEEDFLHTDKFVLIDKKRRIRGIYSGVINEDVERMIEDIKILKKEG